jgi:TPR repeat protein
MSQENSATCTILTRYFEKVCSARAFPGTKPKRPSGIWNAINPNASINLSRLFAATAEAQLTPRRPHRSPKQFTFQRDTAFQLALNLSVHRILATLAAIRALLFSAGSTWAGFYNGVAADQCEDFATALREWRLLAEQGHALAQHNLGFMYENGCGVGKNRGIMEGGMSDVNLAQAQKLAGEWKPK